MPHATRVVSDRVTFTTGIIASIGYRTLRSEETTFREAGAVGCIEISARGEKEGWVIAGEIGGAGDEELEWVLIGYDFERWTAFVALARDADKEPSLACILRFLRQEGYLSRDQELRAYLGFGLAYREER